MWDVFQLKSLRAHLLVVRLLVAQLAGVSPDHWINTKRRDSPESRRLILMYRLDKDQNHGNNRSQD
jgi:hypothetical protein